MVPDYAAKLNTAALPTTSKEAFVALDTTVLLTHTVVSN